MFENNKLRIMESIFSVETVRQIYENQKLLILLVVMAVSFYPIIIFVKNSLIKAITSYVSDENKKYTDIIKKNNIHTFLVKSIASIYLLFWQDILTEADLLNRTTTRFVDVSILIYSTVCITLLLLSIINSLVDLFKLKKLDQKTSIALHAHILKIIIVLCATLVIISHVLNLNISTLFASLGAVAALLTFVFKDTLLGLLASLQLTLQDVIKIGDWIQIDSLKANGTVEQITITNINIRNFDKTVSTVPTAALLSNTVINWRKMKEAGGRRIRRSIAIDMDSVKVCADKDITAYKKLPFISDLLKDEPELFKTETHITNLAIFRHYVRNYLMHHPKIHHENFLLIVRQMDPTPTGMPLEIYAFTNDTDWTIYEDIQSSIFEHLLGILPSFHLKAFQYPCSYDEDGDGKKN